VSLIRVLVVAEDPSVRAHLSSVLGEDPACVVAGAVDPTRESALGLEADVALVDAGRDTQDTIERLEVLDRLAMPAVALVPDAFSGRRALAAGARGALARDAESSTLIAALRAAAHGLAVADPSLATPAALVLDRATASAAAPAEELTPREREVLQLLAEGLPNREIARRLGVSDHTVKFHMNTIFSKLDVHTRTEAVARAARVGLIIL